MNTTNCPSWCEIRHADWEIEPTGHDGPRWPTVRDDEGSAVDIAAGHSLTGDVGVWLSADVAANLTPDQAREAGRALLAAASWVEEHRDT
jgi:hypothetical protein